MTARILYVGEDRWHRLQVLRRAGLSVHECRSVEQLPALLRTGTDPHAVALAESSVLDPVSAASLVRSSSKSAVILFSVAPIEPDPRTYDLVIPPFTSPGSWLDALWKTICEGQKTVADSRAIRETSQPLRRQPAETRRATREQVERAERLVHELQDKPGIR